MNVCYWPGTATYVRAYLDASHSPDGSTFLHEITSHIHLDMVSEKSDCVNRCTFIYLKNIRAKFHPDPVWKDWSLIFLTNIAPTRRASKQRFPLSTIRCRSAVAVRKFRKNYVSAVRNTLLAWKISLRHCRFHLPLRRNCRSVAIGSNPIFCRSAVGGQPISVLVTSSLCMYTERRFQHFRSHLQRQRLATERKNGNGMVETRH